MTAAVPVEPRAAPPNIEAAAATLGITVETLQDILIIPYPYGCPTTLIIAAANDAGLPKATSVARVGGSWATAADTVGWDDMASDYVAIALVSQNGIRTPPLITRPSSGAHASTVHRPSAARSGRKMGSQRV